MDKLHWLRVPQRVKFKYCLLVYKALHGQAPTHIRQFCTNVAEVQRRSTLRSATHNRFILPRSKIKFGNRSFSVAGPSAWNSLPDNIRTSPSLIVVKKQIKNSFVPGVLQLYDIVKCPSLWQCQCSALRKCYHFSFAAALYKLLLLFLFFYYYYGSVTSKSTTNG